MRRTLAVGTAVLLASLAVPAAAAPARGQCERVEDHQVPVPGGLTVPDSTVRVILPEAMCDPGAAQRFPVLFLLHGVGDTWQTWSENTDVVEFTEAFDLIVVMPDGGRGEDAGWYSDWADGSRHWETFHTEVLVDWVDATFPTRGDGHRAVAGMSMGGFGAMKYAARHPGLFQTAASFSGAVDSMIAWPTSGPAFHTLGPFAGTPSPAVWGDQIEDEERWREHNPTDRAADLDGVSLFIVTGTGTPGGPEGDDPTKPATYATEQGIWQMNANFARALAEAGVASNPNGGFDPDQPEGLDWFHVGGQHTWVYWQAHLHWALPQIVDVLGPETTPAGQPAGRSDRAPETPARPQGSAVARGEHPQAVIADGTATPATGGRLGAGAVFVLLALAMTVRMARPGGSVQPWLRTERR